MLKNGFKCQIFKCLNVPPNAKQSHKYFYSQRISLLTLSIIINGAHIHQDVQALRYKSVVLIVEQLSPHLHTVMHDCSVTNTEQWFHRWSNSYRSTTGPNLTFVHTKTFKIRVGRLLVQRDRHLAFYMCRSCIHLPIGSRTFTAMGFIPFHSSSGYLSF